MPFGATVYVQSAVEFSAANSIVVLGTLQVSNAADLAVEDAPDLVLTSDAIITIHGVVIGGDGLSFRNVPPQMCEGRSGGDGSDITIVAPDVLVTGLVAGGDAGVAGPGADGGAGGLVYQLGRLISERHVEPPITINSDILGVVRRGGDAGHGGDGFGQFRSGGDGGIAGDVRCERHPNESTYLDLLFSMPSAGPAPCSKGISGSQSPGTNQGGGAGNGGNGAPGTRLAPDGGDAGSGTNSGSVTCADAQDGKQATSCCLPSPSHGKQGGDGGVSGSGVTMKGGDSGIPGDGYRPYPYLPYFGTGGDAGNAGSSGSVTLKPGGDAGQGGDGVPVGGPGGAGTAGTATIGAAGTLHPPGSGTSSGSAGNGGGTGSINGGGLGALGGPGALCDQ